MARFNLQAVMRSTFEMRNVLSLKQDDLILGYGAAAVMHGLRESTDDLDVDVAPPTYRRYCDTWTTRPEPCITGEHIAFDKHRTIQAMPEGTETQVIKGIRVYTLAQLLKCYEFFATHPDRSPAKKAQDAITIQAIKKKLQG